MAKRLMIQQSVRKKLVYPLISNEVLIGRLDFLDLVIDDPEVSRVHAKMVFDEPRWILYDLESKGGTEVNGEPVCSHDLSDGDIISIGSTRLEYRE